MNLVKFPCKMPRQLTPAGKFQPQRQEGPVRPSLPRIKKQLTLRRCQSAVRDARNHVHRSKLLHLQRQLLCVARSKLRGPPPLHRTRGPVSLNGRPYYAGNCHQQWDKASHQSFHIVSHQGLGLSQGPRGPPVAYHTWAQCSHHAATVQPKLRVGFASTDSTTTGRTTATATAAAVHKAPFAQSHRVAQVKKAHAIAKRCNSLVG